MIWEKCESFSTLYAGRDAYLAMISKAKWMRRQRHQTSDDLEVIDHILRDLKAKLQKVEQRLVDLRISIRQE